MSRKNSILLGTFVMLTLAAVAILIAPTWRGGDARDGLASRDRSAADVLESLPALGTESTPSDGAERREAAPRGDPARLRRGVVKTADGGPIPEGTRVVVRLDNPNYFDGVSMMEFIRMGFGRSQKMQRSLARRSRAERKTAGSGAVDKSGAFEYEAPNQEFHFLDVESDSLYATKWPRRRSADDAPAVVKAARGVSLTGRVVNSDGSAAAGAEILYTEQAIPSFGQDLTSPRMVRTVAAADGGFALRAVPAASPAALVARAPQRAPTVDARSSWSAGSPILLTLLPNAKIAGKVVDSAGSAVAGAEIFVFGSSIATLSLDMERDPILTNAAGEFAIADASPGLLRIRAEKPGLRTCQTPERDARPGALTDFGVLVMPIGSRIEGQVVKPDGAPAAGAAVSLSFTMQVGQLEAGEGGATAGDAAEALTGLDGAFAFEGMGKGPYDLEATMQGFAPGRRKRYVDDGKPLTLKLRRPGTIEIALTWPAASARPKEVKLEFEISVPAGPGFAMAENVKNEKLVLADGPDPSALLRVEDVAPGVYTVIVRAKGFAAARLRGVDVKAAAGARVDAALVPGVSVAGRVIDRVTRAPVPGAEVTRSVSLVEMFQTAPLRVEADEDGKFLIEDLDAGPVSLTAKAPGYASTTTEVGVMAGGDRREGLDIEVGTGGRLEGSVYGEDGFPMGGGIATAAGPAVGTFLQSVIDDSGRFVVPNLPAGQYQVSALRGSFLADAAGSNPNEMLKGMKIGQAEIVDGKTTTIVLGQETGKLVKVFGRVRSGGGPVANAIVTAIPRTEGGMNAMRFTSTGEDGKFEVKIPPGKVTISVANSRSQTGSEKTLDIPAQATFELDFALPEATIEGTVHGPDGAPLAGQPVLLSREQGNVKTIFGSFGQVQSNDEGKYKFENLDEGDYTIAAGGVHLFADTGMKAFGRVSTIVRVASAEAVRGVDFRLDIAGEITGVVSTAGKPLPAASIFLQTPDGRSVNRLSDVFSNASGSFRARGVAAGTYRLLARARGFASKFIEPVVVETGRETQIQVDLTPGASVTVRVLDKEGKPLPGGSVEAADSQGRRLSGLTGLAELGEIFGATSGGPEEVRLGEFGPGKYRIRATKSGYEPGETELSVGDLTPKTLEVRLEKK